MRKILSRIKLRIRAYYMARALDRGHVALAQLKRLPAQTLDDITLRVELSSVIQQGEQALARMKVRT